MIKKKAEALLIPYFVAGFISILLKDAPNAMSCISSLIVGQAVTNDMNYNLPLWFLPMLFLSNCIFLAVLKLRNKKISYTVAVILGGLGYCMMINKVFLPWSLDVALFCQFFLCVGYAITPLFLKLRSIKNNNIWLGLIIVAVSSLVVYIFAVLENGRVDLNARNIHNIALYFVHSFLGATSILLFSAFFEKVPFFSSFMSKIGKHSIDILCWHIPSASLFYGHIVNRFSAPIQLYIWGKHGVWIGVLLLLIFVIPTSVLTHALVFEIRNKSYVYGE